MTKKQDQIISLLIEIQSEIEEMRLRIGEIEYEMLEVTGSISADIRTLMIAQGVKRQRKRPKGKNSEVKTPDISVEEWPVTDPSAPIQELDQDPLV